MINWKRGHLKRCSLFFGECIQISKIYEILELSEQFQIIEIIQKMHSNKQNKQNSRLFRMITNNRSLANLIVESKSEKNLYSINKKNPYRIISPPHIKESIGCQ